MTLSLLIAPAIAGAQGPTAPIAPTSAGGTSAAPDASQAAAIDDYPLGVGDKVKITVYNEPTLSGEFAVGANGKLSLPLIGDIGATGKNAPQIASEVQTALGNGYLRQPQVSAEVTTFRPFFILGEVEKPGQYPYTNGLTVYNAIATAQGFSPRAERKHVFVRRAGTQEEKSVRLTPDLRVFPGDTLRLGERYF